MIKSVIERSFQHLSRLSFTNKYNIVKQNSSQKYKSFAQKEQSRGVREDSFTEQTKKTNKRVVNSNQNVSSLSSSRVKKQQLRVKQKIENNPFSTIDLTEDSLSQMGDENIKFFEECNQNIQDKKYEEAAKNLQDILDNLEEQKAHSDGLQLLELQNSLYLYSRKYLDAYLVRSNISKFMEYAPNNYQQSEIQEQVIKLYYQLTFTHTLQAEVDLDVMYKNHYKNLTSENKALFDIAIAVSHFISIDKDAQSKGVNSILNCIKNTKNISLQSQAFFNLGVYQHQLYENPKKFMEAVLENEQTKESMKISIQQTMNKLYKGEKILSHDISNPLQNILVSLNLNAMKIPIYSISDIIKNKHNLILCDKFSCKALLFLAKNYNLFNIQTDKSLRLQLMHFAYEVATQRQQLKHKANFLYASLFADLKKPSEAKKLLLSIVSDKSNPLLDPIRYQAYLLLSILDFENKYQYKKLAQDVIVKDNLQYWAILVDEYELEPIHMLSEDELTMASNDDIDNLQSLIDEQTDSDEMNTSESEQEDNEDENDQDDDEDDDDLDDVDVMDEEKLKELQQNLKLMEYDIQEIKKNYFK